jgi:O-antigen biosynthesis protein
LKNPSMAVRVWLNYNRALLDFYDRHPERCLLLESYVVARRPSRLIEAIARKFGHHFGPIEDLYDKELYTHHESPQYQALLACCFPEAIEVYHELRSKAEITSSAEFPSHSCDTPVSATADWALQPWIDCRSAEKELKHCRTELAQKEAALKQWDTVSEQTLAAQQQLLTERDNLRTQTHQLREQLELSQQQHQAAQAQIQELESCCLKLQDTVAEQALAAQQQLQAQIQELESCRLKLQHTVAEQALAASDNLRTQTHQLREQLDLSQQQHQAAQLRIQDMENSRFWKLRSWWKRLRHPFRGS